MSENTNEETFTVTLPKSFKHSFTWAPSKESASHNAEITFNFSDLNSGDVLAYIVDSVTIKKQGELRRQFGTDKWVAPSTKDQIGTDGKEYKVEVYEEKVSKPGIRKNTDPCKAEAKKLLATMTESGVSLDKLKEMIAMIKAAEAKVEAKVETEI